MRYYGGTLTEIGRIVGNAFVQLHTRPTDGGRADTFGRLPGLRLVTPTPAADPSTVNGWPRNAGFLPRTEKEKIPSHEFEDDGTGWYLPCGGTLYLTGGTLSFDCFVLIRLIEGVADYEKGWRRSYEKPVGLANSTVANIPLGWGYQSVECNVDFYVDLGVTRGITLQGAAGQVIQLPPGLDQITVVRQNPDVGSVWTIRGRM